MDESRCSTVVAGANGSDSGYRLVLVESPYAGDVERNVRYARACLRDCFLRGEAPFASHLLYTQDGVLNDDLAEERMQGIQAGLAWGSKAERTVVYIDLGVSGGMQAGIDRATREGRSIEFRKLPHWEERQWLRSQIATAERLLADMPDSLFGDGGFGSHVADLKAQLAKLGEP